ncbi:unnamed protein product, partial [Gongylonema pulchrum]|uniref:PINc domain-containing protein n=1 Tax=Gongylonema pulchrum TaxID=637853 RepID=A0A183D703_9BILA
MFDRSGWDSSWTDTLAVSYLLALHARLSSLLSTAEYLDGSELPCFGFNEQLRRFAASRSTSPITVQSTETVKQQDTETSRDSNKTLEQEINAVQDLVDVSDEHQQYRQAVRENQIKQASSNSTLNLVRLLQELLEREAKSSRVIIEVRPQYLVPDTNTFIDHLESLKQIVESRRFTVLVPTTVLEELVGLSRPSTSTTLVPGLQGDFQDNWVGERAKEAVSYLRGVAERK